MSTTTVHSVKEGRRFAADTSLTVVSCAACHMRYAIPTSLYNSAQAYPGDGPNGWKLTCPLGHGWNYVGTSVEEKLELERRRAGRIAAERDQLQASVRAERAAKSRIRNQRDRERKRAAAGVCPCCNRTFQQLARHMAAKHPDHATPDATA